MIQGLMTVGLTNESHCSKKYDARMHLGVVFSGGGVKPRSRLEISAARLFDD
jgi:hypothetical protein